MTRINRRKGVEDRSPPHGPIRGDCETPFAETHGLDDMQTFAGYAFVGLRDPATNKVQAGIAQLHDGIQQLATFDISPYAV